MSPKKAKMISFIFLAGIFLTSFLVIYHIVFLLLEFILMVVAISINILFYRCPYCKKHLGKSQGMYCPHCGKLVEH